MVSRSDRKESSGAALRRRYRLRQAAHRAILKFSNFQINPPNYSDPFSAPAIFLGWLTAVLYSLPN